MSSVKYPTIMALLQYNDNQSRFLSYLLHLNVVYLMQASIRRVLQVSISCVSSVLIICDVHLQPYMNCKDYKYKLKYHILVLYFVNIILSWY
jgi:hypothetical protein